MRILLASASVAALLATIAAPSTAGTNGPSRGDLARLHAPVYRFNAHAAGDSSPNNKNEDYFPMAVGSWLQQLAAKRVRVVTRESDGAKPGVNQTRPLKDKVTIAKDAIHGVPARMAGDVPGEAPVYFHLYVESVTTKKDGSSEEVLVLEYWLFYGQDASRDRISPIGFMPTLDLAGHAGDWEQVALAVAVLRGPGGAFLRTEVRKGYFTAHGAPCAVERGDFQLENGTHPVVYVAAGKHASYPEPGRWKDPNHYAPWIIHDEYFLGNGFEWRSWERSPILDLDGPATTFTGNPFKLDWRSYGGTFGDDRDLKIPLVGTFPTGQSPKAPRFQSSYTDLAKKAKPWRDVKRTARGLDLGASPRITPAPLPKRLP